MRFEQFALGTVSTVDKWYQVRYDLPPKLPYFSTTILAFGALRNNSLGG